MFCFKSIFHALSCQRRDSLTFRRMRVTAMVMMMMVGYSDQSIVLQAKTILSVNENLKNVQRRLVEFLIATAAAAALTCRIIHYRLYIYIYIYIYIVVCMCIIYIY